MGEKLKSAIVTGASSGIGLSCAKKLLDLGYEVTGISRNSNSKLKLEKNFTHYSCDLWDIKELERLEKDIGAKDISILINASGFGSFGYHEDLTIQEIYKMTSLNLTSVLAVTKIFLRSLKKNGGHIFNISSFSAKVPSPFGAAYSASKAGVAHFGASLFKESRKSSLKVTTITPDITNTPFFDELLFKPSTDPLSYIDPKDIANIVEQSLLQREGTVTTEITLQPQLFKLEKIKKN